MIINFLFLILGISLGAGIVVLYGRWIEKIRKKKPVSVEREKIDISIEDIIRLAALNTALDITSLIMVHKINVRMPEFYEKYQTLIKQEKDLYFKELIAIFSKNRREYVQNLFNHCPGLSVTDVLLVLLLDTSIDNKTIARIMGVSMDTLKKRRSRLKIKLQSDVTVDKAVTGV